MALFGMIIPSFLKVGFLLTNGCYCSTLFGYLVIRQGFYIFVDVI